MPTFNPALPEDNTLIDAGDLRDQLNSLNDAMFQRAPMPNSVAPLVQSISNPPTQAQVTNIQNKINELLEALTLSPV